MAYLNFVLDKLDSRSWNSLLDIGCGDGRMLHEINARFKHKKLAGIDYSPKPIEFARTFNPNIKFYVGDITQKNFSDEKFDVITLIETLEHISPAKIETFLKSAGEYSKAGGLMILTVPSKNLMRSPKHYQHFDKNSITTLLRPHFRIREIYFLNKTSILERMLKRFLDNRVLILNHGGLINFLFKFYKKKLFFADEHNCKRICAIANKI
jgi:cyclopropane fatty-acyl-phospholipid synthase-like methyltransferase